MAGISRAEREALAAVKSKFDAVMPSDEQLESIENIRKAFAKVAVEVHRVAPEGRNKSLAMTALEDGCMRAIRGITHDVQSDEAPAETEATVETVAHTDAVDQEATQVEAPKRRRGPRRRTQEVVEAPAA